MAVSQSFILLAATVFCVLNCFSSVDGKVYLRKIGIPPPGKPNTRAVQPSWGNFTQRLDHFNPQDNRTWTMRYLNNSQFFQNGSPIFIFIGGEWSIHPGYLMAGQMFEMAQKHNGYMFYTEHRFYGKSYPTKDFTTESFKYLTTDQALEDVAHFIQHKKELPKFKNSSVVVVGGSYSATLATWLRLKYPHLVDIAYSSSAPLFAVADFYEYLEVVSEAIEKANKTCANVIEQAVNITEGLLKTPEGVEKVKKAYNLCNETAVTNEPHRSYFFAGIFWLFSSLVQYAHGDDLTYYCDKIINGGQNPFDQLTNFIKETHGQGCVGDYNEYVDYLGVTNISESASRQWSYQTCSEYGFHQTSSSKKQIFGNNVLLPFFYRMCQDLYGPKFGAEIQHYAVNRTNMLYGSVTPKVSYVLSVHGSIDPWHRLGVLKNLTSLSPAIFVNGASHCQDLQSVTNSDSPQLAQAKRQIQTIIGNWLKQIV